MLLNGSTCYKPYSSIQYQMQLLSIDKKRKKKFEKKNLEKQEVERNKNKNKKNKKIKQHKS